jgi:hypothetical protein
MELMTVWFIVLVSANGHRIELPGRYDSDKQCYAAAADLERGHPGARATCVGRETADTRPERWRAPEK